MDKQNQMVKVSILYVYGKIWELWAGRCRGGVNSVVTGSKHENDSNKKAHIIAIAISIIVSADVPETPT